MDNWRVKFSGSRWRLNNFGVACKKISFKFLVLSFLARRFISQNFSIFPGPPKKVHRNSVHIWLRDKMVSFPGSEFAAPFLWSIPIFGPRGFSPLVGLGVHNWGFTQLEWPLERRISPVLGRGIQGKTTAHLRTQRARTGGNIKPLVCRAAYRGDQFFRGGGTQKLHTIFRTRGGNRGRV